MTRTASGADWQAGVMGSTSANGTGAYAAANYIGVTANATAPSTSDTTLAGEVVSGTLVRAQATYAHTNGTTSYTLTHTFTSDQSITLAKFAVFNASSGGTMVFEEAIPTPVAMVSGDQIIVVETINI